MFFSLLILQNVLTFVFYEGGNAVKMISLLNSPSVPGAEYLEVGWKYVTKASRRLNS